MGILNDMMKNEDLCDIIDGAKKKYIASIFEAVTNCHDVYIYGAGINGQKLLDLLLSESVPVTGFCVTKMRYNRESVCGLPIQQVDVLAQDGKRHLIVLGVAHPVNRELLSVLKTLNISTYVDVPDFFEEMLDDLYFRPALEITPVAGCSVNCRYCPQSLFLHKYFAQADIREMNFASFKTCLDKLPLNVAIDFSGFVEPFLSKDAIKMILYAAGQGRDIRLYTTLVGLDMKKWQQIENIPFKRVVLHIPDVMGYANIPMTAEYMQLLRCVADKTKTNGKPFIDMANCQSEPHPDVCKILNNKILISWHLVDRAGNLQADELEKQSSDGDKSKLPYCSRAAFLNHNVLLPNGDVVLCCMDFGMKHKLGNLLEQSYGEIMQDAEYLKLRHELAKSSLCYNCTALKRY